MSEQHPDLPGLDRWPEIALQVRSAPLPRLVSMVNGGPQRAFRVNGRQLTSSFDRVKAAEQACATIPKEAKEAWVYGVGMGDTISHLLSRPGEEPGRLMMRKLHVVVLSRGVFNASLQYCKDGEHGWLDSPRVEMHLASELTEVKLPFAVSPVEILECDPDAKMFADQLSILLDSTYQQAATRVQLQRETEQLAANRKFTDHDEHVDAMRGTDGRDAVVVVGGPSLQGQYQYVHDLAKTHQVICASTVLKMLLKEAYVVPDVVIGIDIGQSLEHHFLGLDLDAVSSAVLLYGPTIYTKVLELWRGRRVWANCGAGPQDDLFSLGTVLHACMDLAVARGAKRVTVIGADLSYPGGRSHADGTAHAHEVKVGQDSSQRLAINGQGQEVLTDLVFTRFRIGAEQLIARHPEVEWYKAGREGVPFQGAHWADEVLT